MELHMRNVQALAIRIYVGDALNSLKGGPVIARDPEIIAVEVD
jgi:hypothetical protein